MWPLDENLRRKTCDYLRRFQVRRENRPIKGRVREGTGVTSSVIRNPKLGALEFYSNFERMGEAMPKQKVQSSP